MTRILVTGSADGLGMAAAKDFMSNGHDVVFHARNTQRRDDIYSSLGVEAPCVIGDLSDFDQVRSIAEQANSLGSFDAIIHNAGVIDGPGLLPTNVVAPYLLTLLVARPHRLIYLSSSMHRSGHADISHVDWSGHSKTHSYSDSKLFVATLMAAVARYWPGTLSHAVDPGWVPTRMGGSGATDDLTLGHQTQAWLATTDDPQAQRSGGYWYHRQLQTPHQAVHDEHFQDELLDSLASFTGESLPTS